MVHLPMLLEAPTDAKIWIAIGVGTLMLVYIMMRNGRAKKDPLDRPSAFTSLSQQRSVERQMQNLLVELNDMARQMSAQIDTRSAKLERLIADADTRIAIMEAGHGQKPDSPMKLVMPAAVDPRHAEVYALADAGRSSAEIARQLHRPSGEIELILALRAT